MNPGLFVIPAQAAIPFSKLWIPGCAGTATPCSWLRQRSRLSHMEKPVSDVTVFSPALITFSHLLTIRKVHEL